MDHREVFLFQEMIVERTLHNWLVDNSSGRRAELTLLSRSSTSPSELRGRGPQTHATRDRRQEEITPPRECTGSDETTAGGRVDGASGAPQPTSLAPASGMAAFSCREVPHTHLSVSLLADLRVCTNIRATLMFWKRRTGVRR